MKDTFLLPCRNERLCHPAHVYKKAKMSSPHTMERLFTEETMDNLDNMSAYEISFTVNEKEHVIYYHVHSKLTVEDDVILRGLMRSAIEDSGTFMDEDSISLTKDTVLSLITTTHLNSDNASVINALMLTVKRIPNSVYVGIVFPQSTQEDKKKPEKGFIELPQSLMTDGNHLNLISKYSIGDVFNRFIEMIATDRDPETTEGLSDAIYNYFVENPLYMAVLGGQLKSPATLKLKTLLRSLKLALKEQSPDTIEVTGEITVNSHEVQGFKLPPKPTEEKSIVERLQSLCDETELVNNITDQLTESLDNFDTLRDTVKNCRYIVEHIHDLGYVPTDHDELSVDEAYTLLHRLISETEELQRKPQMSVEDVSSKLDEVKNLSRNIESCNNGEYAVIQSVGELLKANPAKGEYAVPIITLEDRLAVKIVAKRFIERCKNIDSHRNITNGLIARVSALKEP